MSVLASAIDFGTSLPTFPVLTGPGIVDAANIEATLVGVQKGALSPVAGLCFARAGFTLVLAFLGSP